MLAPNEAAPLLEVPTPLCICTLSIEEARSGKSTKNTFCDSASFTGTPFKVTLICVKSAPLILIPVYPMPVPASEVTTVEGEEVNKYGKSLPMFSLLICSSSMSLKLKGDFPCAFVAVMMTSSVRNTWGSSIKSKFILCSTFNTFSNVLKPIKLTLTV